MSITRIVAAATAGLATVCLAACTGSHASTTGDSAAANAVALGTAGAVATRWWSNGAAKAGSSIDPLHPSAAAGKLATSRTQYCDMLTQTVQSGRSVLSGVGAQDPARLTATVAFVSELRRVAPAEVAGAWGVLGPQLEALMRPGATPSVDAGTAAKTADAAMTISADAKKSCGLDLAKVAAR
ncbi:MAG: hypothetical protein QOG80_1915 [Pseudonocardiales bacterium]|nr:hypothetical protein [Pseudonocardiales bacterium]